MKQNILTSTERGHFKIDWLESRHSFSFGSYRNPERIHFGALRVVNDDIVQGGKGFDMHFHDNMEIITIPISGALIHKDSMNNSSVIKAGDVQLMSAGTGVYHSEFNLNPDKAVHFLQIWIIPKIEKTPPSYQQITLPQLQENKLQTFIQPEKNENSLHIKQQAWFSLAELKEASEFTYSLFNKENGVYIFVLDGQISINQEKLSTGDSSEITETSEILISTENKSKLLFIEVPMIK